MSFSPARAARAQSRKMKTIPDHNTIDDKNLVTR